jgi:acetyltransferase-like isoleucine patch superfamily enzyme
MAKRAKFFVHPKALVDTAEIGEGTRVWAFSHVMKGARIGKNCNIGEHCFIEQGVEVGDDVVIKNGVSLWRGVKIESNVFVGPNAVFTNDRIPRAKLYRQEYDGTIVREGASIGANATLLSRLEVGEYALVGAGSTVTANVPPYAVVYGVPARIRKHICKCGQLLRFRSGRAGCACGLAYAKKAEKVSLL